MTVSTDDSTINPPSSATPAAAATDESLDLVAVAAAGTGYDASVAEPPSPLARVAALLSRQANRIVANWVLRAANLPAFRATPNLGLSQLQDEIPALLEVALTAVGTSDPTIDPEPLARAHELAAAHGRAREAEGFTIGVVLAEYQQLRMEVWAALWRIVDADPTLAGVPRELQSRLSSTFDSLAVAAAEAWVEARLARGAGTARSG